MPKYGAVLGQLALLNCFELSLLFGLQFLSLYRGDFPILGALGRGDKGLVLSAGPLQGEVLPFTLNYHYF